MTPEEKAKDIFDSYWYCLMQSDIRDRHYWSKECALITVEEMISVLPFTDSNASLNEYAIHLKKYLEQVKHEIEKL